VRERLLADAEVDVEAALGANGSTEKSSSTNKSELLVDRLKGAVGLATPSRTGANKELAVSHNSSTAMLMRAWNYSNDSFGKEFHLPVIVNFL
jgi:hypothetical protein